MRGESSPTAQTGIVTFDIDMVADDEGAQLLPMRCNSAIWSHLILVFRPGGSGSRIQQAPFDLGRDMGQLINIKYIAGRAQECMRLKLSIVEKGDFRPTLLDLVDTQNCG